MGVVVVAVVVLGVEHDGARRWAETGRRIIAGSVGQEAGSRQGVASREAQKGVDRLLGPGLICQITKP
jgi:hypothetical protein